MADLGPVPPWVYRKVGPGKTLGFLDLLSLNSKFERSRASRGPPQLDAVQLASSTDSTSSSYPIVATDAAISITGLLVLY